MRKTFLLLLLTAVLAPTAAAQSGRRGVTPTPPQAIEPEIQPAVESRPNRSTSTPSELGALPEDLLKRQLKSLDKGSFSLADFSGKVVVLNLWATWCGPCRMEVPDYEKVRKEFADRETALTLMNGRNSIPQTLVIAADGRIINHWRGYSRGQSRDRLRETLEHALSESSPATSK